MTTASHYGQQAVWLVLAILVSFPIGKRLWRLFYEWFYRAELATAREFNRLLRLDRLRRNLAVADSIVDAERVQGHEYTEMDVAS